MTRTAAYFHFLTEIFCIFEALRNFSDFCINISPFLELENKKKTDSASILTSHSSFPSTFLRSICHFESDCWVIKGKTWNRKKVSSSETK